MFTGFFLLLPMWGFAELAAEVREGEPFEFDEPFLQGAHAIASPQMDRWMLLASELGYIWFVIPADIVLVIGLLLFRHVRKGLFAAVAIAGSALLNLGTKALFARDRPSLWESISPEHTYSFPSGHAMGSATLAAVVAMLLWNTRWRWPALLAGIGFCGWVCASRVYLGVHYPSDILAGVAFAVAWCGVAYVVIEPHRHTPALPDAD